MSKQHLTRREKFVCRLGDTASNTVSQALAGAIPISPQPSDAIKQRFGKLGVSVQKSKKSVFHLLGDLGWETGATLLYLGFGTPTPIGRCE